MGVLDKHFNRVPKGTVTTIAMKQSTVTSFNLTWQPHNNLSFQIDRNSLVSEDCVTRNHTFEEIYGVNITKVNCEMAHYKTSPYLGQNCSLLPYYRWNNSKQSEMWV